MMEKVSPQRLILEAVVVCIEKYGIDKVTTRKIAQQAGTNIASINYYFRSKDELIEKALSMTINHMLEDVIIAVEDAELSLEETLVEVFYYLMNGSLQFPGVSTAHLYKALLEKHYDSVSARAIRKIYERVCKRAIRDLPGSDAGKIRLSLSQIFSSMVFNMLVPGFFPVPARYQLTGPRRARALAEHYAALFLQTK